MKIAGDLRENYVRMVKETRDMTLGEKTSRFFEISDRIQFVPCRSGSKGSAKKDGYYLSRWLSEEKAD